MLDGMARTADDVRENFGIPSEYLRKAPNSTTEEEWFGWQPMTSDGLPYIYRVPRYDNVWLAAGHT